MGSGERQEIIFVFGIEHPRRERAQIGGVPEFLRRRETDGRVVGAALRAALVREAGEGQRAQIEERVRVAQGQARLLGGH